MHVYTSNTALKSFYIMLYNKLYIEKTILSGK